MKLLNKNQVDSVSGGIPCFCGYSTLFGGTAYDQKTSLDTPSCVRMCCVSSKNFYIEACPVAEHITDCVPCGDKEKIRKNNATDTKTYSKSTNIGTAEHYEISM